MKKNYFNSVRGSIVPIAPYGSATVNPHWLKDLNKKNNCY